MDTTVPMDDVQVAHAQPESPFATMLRIAVVPSLVAGLACAVVYFFVGGMTSGLSALFGGVLAVAFFAGGLLVMRRVRGLDPMLLAAAGMAVFFGQLIVLGLVLYAAAQVSSIDRVATGVTVFVVVIVWQVFQVIGFKRSRIPVYDEPAGEDQV